MDFLSGEFTYMADAAMFRDCATGLRFPVAQTGDYLRTEREYTARSQGSVIPCMYGCGGIST